MKSLVSNRRALTVYGALVLALAGCARFEDKPLAADQLADRIESRSLADEGLRSFLLTNSPGETREWPLKQWDLESLTLAAFYFHPSLDVARAQWASAQAGINTAGGRPNPILSATPGYSANPPRGVSPWFPTVTLDVPIETAGKRGYRIDHSRHLSGAARLSLATAAWQVRAALRSALVDAVAAQSRADAARAEIAAREQALALLQQRFAAGAASTPELSPARIALLKLRADLMDIERAGADARARVAEAIGVPLNGIEGAQFTFPPSQHPSPDPARVRRNALLGRADILGALAEYDAAQSALQLEIAKQYPDLHFNPGYQYDQGENKWSLGLSIELPLLNQNQGPIAEAKARREEAAARFIAAQAKAVAELDRAATAVTTAEAQARQAAQLMELQQQQFRMLENALQAGGADQYELATARVELAAAELAGVEARIRQLQAEGLLEAAAQIPFHALSVIERDPKSEITKENP